LENRLMDDKAFHSRLLDMFTDAEEASDKSRSRAERDIDYYNGKQWTDKEVSELKKRGQPAIAFNLIRNKIDYLQGLERQQRTSPRALPRTPMHEQDSEGVTDALRYVCDDQHYDDTKSRVWADMLKAGWGGVEITVEERFNRNAAMATTAMTQPDYDVVMTRCAWDRMFWDPHSAEDDFSDATYLGLVIWMDREEASRRYGPEAKAVYDETINATSIGDTYDDRPRLHWVDSSGRKRIRVVQVYYIDTDGEWSFAEYTRGGILRNGPSPWEDEDGKREHPYSWRSSYVDRDNNRYGAVRDLVDPQDEINKRKSKSLHYFTSRQTYGNQTFGDVAENKKQLQKADGHVDLQGPAVFGQDFGIIPTNDQAQGHMEHMQMSMSVFEVMGPNAAMQGKQEGRQSGRAILAQQQGGQTQMGLLTDALRQMDMEVYRKVWNRIRQFWTGERWIRVTDDQRNLKWVGLNPAQPYDLEQMENASVMQTSLADVDIDIILDDAPAVGALMDEQFALLVDLKQMDTNGEIPFKALIAAAPNLRAKADLLKAITERESQPPNPIEVAGVEAELADKQASTQLKQAQAAKAMSDAQAAGMGGEGGPSELDIAKALADIRSINASTAKTIAETDKVVVETDLVPQKMAHDARIASQRLNSGAGSNGQSATGR
jgi:hypothetical protein